MVLAKFECGQFVRIFHLMPSRTDLVYVAKLDCSLLFPKVSLADNWLCLRLPFTILEVASSERPRNFATYNYTALNCHTCPTALLSTSSPGIGSFSHPRRLLSLLASISCKHLHHRKILTNMPVTSFIYGYKTPILLVRSALSSSLLNRFPSHLPTHTYICIGCSSSCFCGSGKQTLASVCILLHKLEASWLLVVCYCALSISCESLSSHLPTHTYICIGFSFSCSFTCSFSSLYGGTGKYIKNICTKKIYIYGNIVYIWVYIHKRCIR